MILGIAAPTKNSAVICILAVCVALLLFINCGSEHETDSFRVTMVCDVGGLGDQGFNDAGWRGLLLAQERDPEIEPKVIQSREQADYINNLSHAAETSRVVVALGFLMIDAVQTVSQEYPDTPFVFVDGSIDQTNVASFEFKAHEIAFLAGMMGCAASETGTIAVMPGMDIPPVEAFRSGYQAGAEYMAQKTGREIEVLSNTIGSFSDPVKARGIAEGLMAQKADVIFQLAGASGLGVLDAVRDAPGRRYMIGVDVDQDDLAPGKVLVSALKRIDLVVAHEIAAVKNGEFEGGLHHVGLAEEAVGFTAMKHTRHVIPPAVFGEISEASQAIIDGQIKPPRNLKELDTFLAQRNLK